MLQLNTPTIETQRLILRKFEMQDVDAFYKIMSDEKTNVFLPWFSVKSKEQAKEMLKERYLQTYQKPSGYRYAVCLKTDNIPIGYVCLSDGESCDFGYGLHSKFWNNNIISEAAMAVISQIKKSGFRYITATHDVQNPASGRIMQKMGMTYRYSYVEQWQPKDISVTFRMYQLNFDHNVGTYEGYRNQYENHFVETLK